MMRTHRRLVSYSSMPSGCALALSTATEAPYLRHGIDGADKVVLVLVLALEQVDRVDLVLELLELKGDAHPPGARAPEVGVQHKVTLQVLWCTCAELFRFR